MAAFDGGKGVVTSVFVHVSANESSRYCHTLSEKALISTASVSWAGHSAPAVANAKILRLQSEKLVRTREEEKKAQETERELEAKDSRIASLERDIKRIRDEVEGIRSASKKEVDAVLVRVQFFLVSFYVSLEPKHRVPRNPPFTRYNGKRQRRSKNWKSTRPGLMNSIVSPLKTMKQR